MVDGSRREMPVYMKVAELLYETRLFPKREYTFKHALTHEVAYGGLFQERRRVLHGRIVKVLEALAAERLGEQVDRLAQHAVRGEVWAKALAQSVYREAVGSFEQALALARAHQERGNEAYALRLLGDIAAHRDPPEVGAAATHYRQALALVEDLGMHPLQAHCHRGLGTLYAAIGQREQARAELATAVEMYRGMAMTFWLPQTETALAQMEGCRS